MRLREFLTLVEQLDVAGDRRDLVVAGPGGLYDVVDARALGRDVFVEIAARERLPWPTALSAPPSGRAKRRPHR